MKLITLTVGSLEENTYIYYDENTNTGILIDPGDEQDKILKEINRRNITISDILLTHGHYDHTGAVNFLKSELNTNVCAHKEEDKILLNPRASYDKKGETVPADKYFDDNDEFIIGNCRLKVLHTPGHTIGSCCYYDDSGIIFSGDTLFRLSIGRHNFPTGNYDSIMSSIKNKLFVLPDDTIVFPGHGPATTIGFEKQNNPFFQ